MRGKREFSLVTTFSIKQVIHTDCDLLLHLGLSVVLFRGAHGHDGHRDCDVVTAAPVTFVNVEMSRDQYWLPISWTEVARELDQLADAFGSTLEVLRVSHASRTHVSETDTNGKYPLCSLPLVLLILIVLDQSTSLP